jgi:hypothetical protein
LPDEFNQYIPNALSEKKYEGNRATVFDVNEEIPVKELSYCIAMALTHHRSKKTEE